MADVVNDSARQRQSEQAVRQSKVDQIDGGRVELLGPLADDIENQAVTTCADDENYGVENGEEDSRSSLVNKHIAVTLVWRGLRQIQGDVFTSHLTAYY